MLVSKEDNEEVDTCRGGEVKTDIKQLRKDVVDFILGILGLTNSFLESHVVGYIPKALVE